MAIFVLIHGAWHGAWCWERVVPLLEQQGHTVLAPDLACLGADRTPVAEVTLPVWTQAAAALVEAAAEPVILVGHSRGGLVISEVAERVPDRVRTLVYLTAFLMPAGRSLAATLALVPPHPDAQDGIIVSADGLSLTVAADRVARVFFNTTEPAWSKRALGLLRPEPAMSFSTPVHTTPGRFGSVPRAYIECLQDSAIPVALQRLMQETLPCGRVISLDTDHSPFYSAPEALADALLAIAAEDVLPP